MSYEVPPGFEPHDRKSPLTAPWEPIYCKAEGTSVALGVEIREPHTNSRGLVHGGLVAALLDNVMGLACSKALLAQGPQARSLVTVSLGVEYLGMAKLGQWLTFEPHFVKAGKTLCFAEASAVADGVIIARGKSTFRTGVARF
jgi:acyl-coenzyme A thioesterase PaaI-like protein